MDAGEQFSPRMLEGRGLGHTPSEFIALVNAKLDREAAQAAAREAQEFRRWQAEQSADVSAPTEAELEEKRDLAARLESRRARKRRESKVIQSARALARMDRESERARGFR
jgi:hypothetical protein